MLSLLVRPICDDSEVKLLDATLPDLGNILISEDWTLSEELPAHFQSRDRLEMNDSGVVVGSRPECCADCGDVAQGVGIRRDRIAISDNPIVTS